jgi:hypothetical protein
LKHFQGYHVIEIKGEVEGSFKSEGHVQLVMKTVGDEAIIVDSGPEPEDWLLRGEIAVRALVHAYRSGPKGTISLKLIAVLPAEQVRETP